MDDAARSLVWRGPDPALCPIRIQSSIQGYMRGLPTGDFLRAVLCNDLHGAIVRADPDNLAALCHIVAYVHEHVPLVAWGDVAKVDRWLNERRNSPSLAEGSQL